MIFDLPMPPSVNNLFINAGRRRVASPEYRAWQQEAGLMLRRQRPKAFEGRAEVIIDLDDRGRGDADNRSKVCLDLLVRHGVLPDDSKKYVKRVSVGWEPIHGCRVTIKEAL